MPKKIWSFFDKCVTEIELPHLSESNNNDTSFYTVKDICIDEGVQSFQKILVESGKVNNDNSAIWKSMEAYGNAAPMAELTQNGIPQDSKPSSVNEGQVTLGKLLEGNIEGRESLSPCKFETYSNDAKERSVKV
ncbi:hypothetical protein HPP92_017629 [Vanilla planifolia]|uniref:Uncharacterized protein n=1 Tax=Vanilla planifolia TaxID=51239 RepID=A0A835QCK6_VANPL|nr:hypothetical protein HPP92_017629 [Vanilla planifolia]